MHLFWICAICNLIFFPGTGLAKACVCKNTHNTNNQALQVLWHSQTPTSILLSVWPNDVKCTATGAMHPQTPLNPCTTFMLCLPMWGLELPVCSVEVLCCMLCTWQGSVKLHGTVSTVCTWMIQLPASLLKIVYTCYVINSCCVIYKSLVIMSIMYI